MSEPKKGNFDIALVGLSEENNELLIQGTESPIDNIDENKTLGSTEHTDFGFREKDYAEVIIEDIKQKKLLYDVVDHPPIVLSILSGLQHTLLSLSSALAISFLVADVVCADQNEELKSKLLSSNFFMNGLTTISMNLFGIRLPLFQGASSYYLVPLLVIQVIEKDKCSLPDSLVMNKSQLMNSTSGGTELLDFQYEKSWTMLRELQGCLIAAGLCHFLVGLTGLVGVILRFVGPITILPTIFLAITYVTRATAKFAMVYWGVSLPVAAIAIILSVYLANFKCSVPVWTKKRGLHFSHYPIHQVFSLLIAIIIGWILCGILTTAGVFSDDKSHREYLARTDAKTEFIGKAPWFNIPYPGQFGSSKFNISVFVGFLIGTITSILDSIGDYHACAKMCDVPPPPPHAVNRGIAIEGLMSTISGFVGCGHATSTYGGNIGAIGITRVASRDVFLATGIIYVMFGIIGKVSAVFLTIPYPVLGGALIVMYGMFAGVVLSNLELISLSSSRNLAIIGISILFGLMMPYWVEKFPDQISVGSAIGDGVVKMLLANPSLIGGMLACILDNTVSGSDDERGISAWKTQIDDTRDNKREYSVGYEVYQPLLYDWIIKIPLINKLPIIPKKVN